MSGAVQSTNQSFRGGIKNDIVIVLYTQLHTEKINSRKNATKLALSLDEINTAVFNINTSDFIPLTSELPSTGLERMNYIR